jgi:hypothetical protein
MCAFSLLSWQKRTCAALACPIVQRPDRCRCILSRWPRLLLENALHHTRADAELPADLEDAVTAGLQFKNSRFHSWVNPTGREFARETAENFERPTLGISVWRLSDEIAMRPRLRRSGFSAR